MDISPDILKPARYTNKEWNSVHKDWGDGILKVALCFPDIYEVGMSHLGLRILYGLLNQDKDVLCERIFAPWIDMEQALRLQNTTLFSLESKKSMREFDIVGFSLQYEMNFIDVLNMLDLGSIPVYAKDRGDNDPLIIAGGPCVFNPLPMADFIDIFVIGEAEEVILKFISVLKNWSMKSKQSRYGVLKELSKIQGVYVPILTRDYVHLSIKKNIVNDLDNAYFPISPVVPYIQIVHDRIGIEIMRGCIHNCKFCQAYRIFRPCRIRSVDRILELIEQSIRNTGYEEVSLLSLSSGDYPYLGELIEGLEKNFTDKGVKISFPSLRVRDFSHDKEVRILKKGTLTYAPESGNAQLRAYLNKDIKDEDIVQKSQLALKSGWKKIKLYFMIGLPSETETDLSAIIELAGQISRVSLSISHFIPKPHSEFEREGMDVLERLLSKERYLRSLSKSRIRRKDFVMDFHNPEMSIIECVLSRGDREIARVIHKVWKKGKRLQAWSQYFDYKVWTDTFQECGIDFVNYLNKIPNDVSLPWGFIEV